MREHCTNHISKLAYVLPPFSEASFVAFTFHLGASLKLRDLQYLLAIQNLGSNLIVFIARADVKIGIVDLVQDLQSLLPLELALWLRNHFRSSFSALSWMDCLVQLIDSRLFRYLQLFSIAMLQLVCPAMMERLSGTTNEQSFTELPLPPLTV